MKTKTVRVSSQSILAALGLFCLALQSSAASWDFSLTESEDAPDYPFATRMRVAASGTTIFKSVLHNGADREISQWTPGSGWVSIGNTVYATSGGDVNRLIVVGDYLYVTGSFTDIVSNQVEYATNAPSGSLPANNVARYHVPSGTWTALIDANGKNGVTGSDLALAVMTNGDIYVGGYGAYFGDTAPTPPSPPDDTIPLMCVLRATNNVWENLPRFQLGTDLTGVYDLAAVGSNLYVVGEFVELSSGATNAACLNTASGTWSSIGLPTGYNERFYRVAYASTSGLLYIGGGGYTRGSYDTVDSSVPGTYAVNLASNTWTQICAGAYGNGFATDGVNLYVGGPFNEPWQRLIHDGSGWLGMHGIAKWSASSGTWSGLLDGTAIDAMDISSGDAGVIAVGLFADGNGDPFSGTGVYSP